MKQSVGAKTLATPTPVWLVGTYDEAGVANIMTAAWGGICCSQPPCVAVSLRKATYSHAAIVARKAFTVSIPSQAQVAQADYVGTVSGRDGDKFAACGWTPVKSDLVDAPYVDEVPLVVECRLLHIHELGLHTQFVGEIVDVKADETVIGAKGYPDITRVRPMIWDTAHMGYYGLGEFLGKAWQVGTTVTPEGMK
ncbi:flavin reductase family protein [Geobacter sp. FeAm09]|uniref:flavin reductase family protein n=1 Tax=Geobacter sp. FeAm09 TaxID=2597769 RepID=UPI0011EBD48D|nr:flavin reductase family protein [Geobacter sp. FeAm09]QEM68816.1 flavin reductase family protein [Geobacter sp. FeAm09]